MIEFFREFARVTKSTIHVRLDRLRLWWGYRVALADRHLFERGLRKTGIPNDPIERDEGSVRLSIHESFVSIYERDHLLNRCIAYGVPLPRIGDPDYFDKIAEPDLWGLTPDGKQKLLVSLRQARAERIDGIKSIALAASSVLSLVVALFAIM